VGRERTGYAAAADCSRRRRHRHVVGCGERNIAGRTGRSTHDRSSTVREVATEMKYLPLLWAGLWRKPIRSVLTLLSITVAFLLFGVLNGVIAGFDHAVSKMSEMRLRVVSRANILEPMPISYEARIARMPGVRIVSHLSVLIGYYQEPRNNVSAVALTLGPFAKMFNSEMHVPADQVEALQTTRDGAIVGIELAKRNNWQIGDRVTLHSLNQIKSDGSPEW